MAANIAEVGTCRVLGVAIAALAAAFAADAPAAVLRQVAPEAAYASSTYKSRVPGQAIEGDGLSKFTRNGWKYWIHSTEKDSTMWMSTDGDYAGWFIVKFASPVKLRQRPLLYRFSLHKNQ